MITTKIKQWSHFKWLLIPNLNPKLVNLQNIVIVIDETHISLFEKFNRKLHKLHIFTMTKSSITWVGDVTKGGLWSVVFNALFASWLKYSLTPCKVYYYIALCTLQMHHGCYGCFCNKKHDFILYQTLKYIDM